MTDIHSDKILILDFGAQYTQLIARRIREAGVYCEIWAWDHNPADIAAFAPRGIILSGGPESTTEAGSPRAPDEVFAQKVPVLGICYGMQTMAMQFGGLVESGHHREFGAATVNVNHACSLLDGINDEKMERAIALNSVNPKTDKTVVVSTDPLDDEIAEEPKAGNRGFNPIT